MEMCERREEETNEKEKTRRKQKGVTTGSVTPGRTSRRELEDVCQMGMGGRRRLLPTVEELSE